VYHGRGDPEHGPSPIAIRVLRCILLVGIARQRRARTEAFQLVLEPSLARPRALRDLFAAEKPFETRLLVLPAAEELPYLLLHRRAGLLVRQRLDLRVISQLDANLEGRPDHLN